MWEIEVRNLKNGRRELLYGYDIEDAFKRAKLNQKDWHIIHKLYVD